MMSYGSPHFYTYFLVLKVVFLTWIIYYKTVVQVFVLKSQGSNEIHFLNFKMHFNSKERIMKQKFISNYLKMSKIRNSW